MAPIKSDDHLPEPEKRSRIWLPGMQTPKDVAKKLLIPAKRLLVPQGKDIDPDEAATADAPGELKLARRFNHKERRFHMAIGRKLHRRQLRKQARNQRRLDQALYEASASSHSHVRDPKTQKWVAVRFDAKGKRLAAIGKPPLVDIRPRTGYLEANGPKELRKSAAQLDLENGEGARQRLRDRKPVLVDGVFRVSGAPEGRAYVRHDGTIRVAPPKAVMGEGKPRRQKGSWAPPKAKAKQVETAA